MPDKKLPEMPAPELGQPVDRPDRPIKDGDVTFWLVEFIPANMRNEIKIFGPKSSFSEFLPYIESRLGDAFARTAYNKLRYVTNEQGNKVPNSRFETDGFTEDFEFTGPDTNPTRLMLYIGTPIKGHTCSKECCTALFGYMPFVKPGQDHLSFKQFPVDPRYIPTFLDHTTSVGHFSSIEEAKAHCNGIIASKNPSQQSQWQSYGSTHERWAFSEDYCMKTYVCKDRDVPK